MVDQHLKQLNSENHPFFLYKFSFPGPYSFSPVFSGSLQDFGEFILTENFNSKSITDKFATGVIHCDDLIYLLKAPLIFPKDFPLYSTEAEMRSKLVSFLTSFAKTG